MDCHFLLQEICPTQGWNTGLLHCRQRLYHLSHQGNKECLILISPGCSLKGLLLKLKLQYFGHMMWRRSDSLEKTLMLGKIEGRRRRERQSNIWDGWMASPTQWTWVWVDSRNCWWEAWHAAVHAVTKSRTWLSDWTELNPAFKRAGSHYHLYSRGEIGCGIADPRTWLC